MPLVLSAVFGCSLQWKNCPFAGFISFTWGFSTCEITKWYIMYMYWIILIIVVPSSFICIAPLDFAGHGCTTARPLAVVNICTFCRVWHYFQMKFRGLVSRAYILFYTVCICIYIYICIYAIICMYMLRIRGSSEVASCLFFIFHHLSSVVGYQRWTRSLSLHFHGIKGVMPCSLVQDSGFFNNIIFLDVEGLGFFLALGPNLPFYLRGVFWLLERSTITDVF